MNFSQKNAMGKTAITETITTLKEFIRLLCKIQGTAWDNDNPSWFERDSEWKRSNQALETYKSIYANWQPIIFEKIEYQFQSSELELNFSHWSQVLYLPPLKKDANFVPILSPYYKLSERQSIAKLRVMLICRDNCLDENRKPYGIGFRLETPENMNQVVSTSDDNQNSGTENDIGTHDFHHAQLIQNFGQGKLDRLKIGSLPWLPESQPSFPLPAKCPVTLLLCLIVTLYGGKSYSLFFKEYKSEITGIEHYLGNFKPWITHKITQGTK